MNDVTKDSEQGQWNQWNDDDEGHNGEEDTNAIRNGDRIWFSLSSFDRYQSAKLCFITLHCITEDQYANSLMHDVNMNFRVPIFRLPMRHRKGFFEKVEMIIMFSFWFQG